MAMSQHGVGICQEILIMLRNTLFNLLILPISAIFILLSVVPSGFAGDYTFQWDANHPNDNVVAYRIYWSTTSGSYTWSWYILVNDLHDPLKPQYTVLIPEASPDQTYYFVCSAVDNHGYESDFSSEINTASPDGGGTPVPPPDAVPPDTTEPDTTPPDTSEPDTAPPDTSEPDTAPPEFTSWPMVTYTTDETAIIAWSTNEESDSQVRYGLAATPWENYNFETSSSSMIKNHRMTLTNLRADTAYFLRVASKDIQGNGPLISNEITFTTDQTPDEEEPEITSPPTVINIFETDAGIQSGVINVGIAATVLGAEEGNISAAISWKTDEQSNSEVRYGKTSTTWDQYSNTVVDDALVKTHTVILTGLMEGWRYYFRAGSTDALGNGPSSDPTEKNNPFKELSFSIEKPADARAPRILNGPDLTSIDNGSAVIAWKTDEPGSSMLQYGLSDAGWGGFDHNKVITDMRTNHSVAISGLAATTRYYFMVGSMDAMGNGPGENENATNPSAVNSFWTTDLVDETPPDISNIAVSYATDTTALIQWDTDEPGNSMVQYDLISRAWGQYEYSANDSEMVTSHSMTLTGLQIDTTYHFRLASTDARGNGPGTHPDLPNPSEELTFMTAKEPDENAPQISDVSIIVQEDGQSVVVGWLTDEPGNSLIGYDQKSGEWSSYAYSENNPELTREHSVTLTNLETNIDYYYRVSSMDASGNSYDTSANDQNPSTEFTFQLDSDAAVDDQIAPAGSVLLQEEPGAQCFIGILIDCADF